MVSSSGTGSTIDATAKIREQLPAVTEEVQNSNTSRYTMW